MARRAATLLLLLAALACTLLAGGATAAPTVRTSLPEIEEQVMCVVCKTPLAVANGPQADAERDFIRERIAQGLTQQQIKDALVVQYGDRVLALPKEHGFNLAVYLIPIAVLVAGLALLAAMLPRWRRSARARALAGSAATGDAGLSDEDTRRLDEDLARYDG
jgi:cytochrome c-type biogenesis protein CcmH/NrfF